MNDGTPIHSAHAGKPETKPKDQDSAALRYLRIARGCGAGSILIGVAGTLGWILDSPALKSIVPGLQPIVISTSLVFIILGGVQITIARASLNRRTAVVLLGLSCVIVVFGLSEIIHLATGMDVSLDDAMLRHFPSLFANPYAHLSPATGIFASLIALAQGLFLLKGFFENRARIVSTSVGLIGSMVLLGSSVFVLGYIYGVPLLYHAGYIPISLPAALAVLVSGAGLAALAGPTAVPLRWFTGKSTRARLLRAFLPLTVLVMLLLSFAQYFLTRFTNANPAIAATMNIAVFEIIVVIVSLQAARMMGNLIDRQEEERRIAATEKERLIAELRRSNQELEQFANVASHDLREPLRMVESFTGLLERKYADQLDEKAHQYIHFAADGARRMQKLIDGLLAYSRITRQAAEFKPVNLNNVVAAAISNLSVTIQETGAEITREKLPVIPGDETQLVQLFQNLIGNGLKYRKPDSTPRLHISAKKAEGKYILSVKDNGIGIDPAYFDRIFLIFQRLHTQAEYSGSGIGLAVCKRIVERHHGQIWVESVPGDGSTFFFSVLA